MLIALPQRVLACLLLWLATAANGYAASYPEEAVKAAFLHRFGAYVQWPAGTASPAPFVIAVLGADEVADQLGQLLPGLLIQDRPAEVRKVDERANLDGVRILYIGSGRLRRARNLLTRASNRPILIVTDDTEGITRGGAINFVELEHHIRFEVSIPAAERSGLRIDSGLLSVAARVVERRRPEKKAG